MDNKAIVLKQAPIIEYSKLDAIAIEVEKRLSIYNFDELVITEDTVKGIKELRATLNKELKVYEDERKAIKKLVLAPYEAFDSYYNEKIKSLYDTADTKLKKGIDEVENRMKAEKEAEVRTYFKELLAEAKIDFVTYEQAKINLTLSASMKSLKETAKEFVDHIASCIVLIQTQDNQDRIMSKFKRTLDATSAIREVAEEIKSEKELQEKREAMQKAEEERAKAVKEEVLATTPLEAPTTAPVESEELLTTTFTITGMKSEIIAVRDFMIEKGIKYE